MFLENIYGRTLSDRTVLSIKHSHVERKSILSSFLSVHVVLNGGFSNQRFAIRIFLDFHVISVRVVYRFQAARLGLLIFLFLYSGCCIVVSELR